MKESEIIKDYSDRLLVIANYVRILKIELNGNKIIQKILKTLTERYEESIATLLKICQRLDWQSYWVLCRHKNNEGWWGKKDPFREPYKPSYSLVQVLLGGIKEKERKEITKLHLQEIRILPPVITKKASILLVNIVGE